MSQVDKISGIVLLTLSALMRAPRLELAIEFHASPPLGQARVRDTNAQLLRM